MLNKAAIEMTKYIYQNRQLKVGEVFLGLWNREWTEWTVTRVNAKSVQAVGKYGSQRFDKAHQIKVSR